MSDDEKARVLFERWREAEPKNRALCRAELLALSPEAVVRGAQLAGGLFVQTALWSLLQHGPALRWLPALVLLARQKNPEFDTLAWLVAERLAECVQSGTSAGGGA